ncbi:MAG TPA: RND family transporter [Archaeoglobaceae archaeon]|nr:RND family transporter [Archaeoglobaceae archaeon]
MASEKIFEFFSRIVSRMPVVVILLVILLFMAGLEMSQNVKMDQGYKTYFSKEHKEFRQSELFSKDFGTSIANAYIFVKSEDVVNYEMFEYMLKLEDSISGIDGIGEIKSAARSVVNRFGYLPNDENILRDYVYRCASFYVPKRSFALIEIEITAPTDRYDQIAKELERRLELVPKPAGVVVEATGNPVVRYQVNQAISGSMMRMGMAAIVLMVLILIIVFRGVVKKKRFLMLPLVISIFTTVMVYGLMPVLGIPLTDVTNAFFPVLIGLSIEYAAQFQNRFEEEMRRGFTTVKAAVNSIKSVGVALTLAMITTVIGFLSMVFSGVPALSWFGYLSAIGLFVAYLLSLTFLPAVLIVAEKGRREAVETEKRKDIMGGMLRIMAKETTKRPKIILAVTLILVSVGYYGYSNVGLLTDFYKYIPQDLPAMRKMNELESIVGSSDRIIAVIETDKLNTDFINRIDDLSKYVTSSEPKITDYSSIATLLRMYNNGELPESQLELHAVMDRIPPEQMQRYMSGNTIAVYFTVASMDWLEFRELYERVKEEIDFFGLSEGFFLTGDVVLKMFVADLIVNGQNKMTLASFALVTILLLIVYRSIRNAIVPLLPITTTIILVGALMYISGMYRSLISASLNSLTIGLGIDFSIHVMERYLEERKLGRSPEEAVEITVSNIGKAIMTSGLTMAGGFAAMMVSPFPIMRDFGMVSVAAILLSLVAALTLVPAFLITTERFRKSPQKSIVTEFKEPSPSL